jgi:hypothetical protein
MLLSSYNNHIGGVMVSMFASSEVDRVLEPRSGQTKDYNIGICYFSAKHAASRRKSKDWLVRNPDDVAEWGYMSISGQLLQWAENPTKRVGLVKSGPHHHLIEY